MNQEQDFSHRKIEARDAQPSSQPAQNSPFYPFDVHCPRDRQSDDHSGIHHPLSDANPLEMYQDFWDRAVCGLYRANFDGRFLSVNAAYAQILGYDHRDQLLSAGISLAQDVYHSPTRWGELLSHLQQEETVQGFESPIVTCQGTIHWVTESIRLVSDAHNGRYILEGIIHDITDRKTSDLEREHESLSRDRFWWTFWQDLK
jgi:PAS domain S-box-containing protein